MATGCFHVQDPPTEHGHYIALWVNENDPVPHPLSSTSRHLRPHRLGTTLDEAQTACVALNASIGVSKAEAERIVASSQRARQRR